MGKWWCTSHFYGHAMRIFHGDINQQYIVLGSENGGYWRIPQN
jgi:hypothetical protein